MKNNEIKTAWNTFKKEAKKELSFGINGCCYMTAKQIAARTATIFLTADWEYDKAIAYHLNSIERVNGYNTWTEEEKKHHEEYELRMVEYYKRLQATYSTPGKEAEAKAEEIRNSKAFQKLSDAIGLKWAELERVNKDGMHCYQVRIHY